MTPNSHPVSNNVSNNNNNDTESGKAKGKTAQTPAIAPQDVGVNTNTGKTTTETTTVTTSEGGISGFLNGTNPVLNYMNNSLAATAQYYYNAGAESRTQGDIANSMVHSAVPNNYHYLGNAQTVWGALADIYEALIPDTNGELFFDIGLAIIALEYNFAKVEAKMLERAVWKESKLTKSQIKSIKSLKKRITEHMKKIEEFKKNPTIKPGMEKMPKEVIEKQQQIRIKHLENEINTFKENIQKITNGEL